MECQTLENVVGEISSCRKGGFHLIFEPVSYPVCPAADRRRRLFAQLRQGQQSCGFFCEKGRGESSLLPKGRQRGEPRRASPGWPWPTGLRAPSRGKVTYCKSRCGRGGTAIPGDTAAAPGCAPVPTGQTERCPGRRAGTGLRGCSSGAAGQDTWLPASSLCGLREVNDPRFAHRERGCNKPSLLRRVCQLSLRAQAPAQDRQIRYEAR